MRSGLFFAETYFYSVMPGSRRLPGITFFHKTQMMRTPFWMTALMFSSLSARITLP